MHVRWWLVHWAICRLCRAWVWQVQDEKGALADIVRSSLQAARAAAQGTGAESVTDVNANQEARLNAVLQQHTERMVKAVSMCP